ncbi:hypothetical protein [Enterococcus mundtii]|uniref:hypothetical protein n=1 Tax=Enterococcus mundtii TaxID=53346 RepID=UPI001A96189F|nr:hypothetical protein [Enterococcus mundtii]MBO1087236.1 hypothetical protein [Enterococcus mundtii]
MKPYLNLIENFDATQEYVVYFTYLGSSRMIRNKLSIRETNSDLPVYERESTKFDKNHIIPAGVLQNGKSYKAKIQVMQEVGEEWTGWSPEVEFLCLSTPVITFDNIDNQKFVYNDDIMMTAIYRQEQGEKVETFQFTLMDSNKVPITEYPVRFPDLRTPSIFQERMSGLVKGRLYYVSCRVITANGINHFELKEFIPQYIAPTVNGIVQVSNQDQSGQVLVQSFLKQMLGTQAKAYVPYADDDGEWNYVFLDKNWIVIPPNMPLVFTRLGMAKSSDWVAKVWCKNIPNGLMFDFSRELGEDIHMKFYKHDDYITCEKEYLGIKSRTKSNTVKGLNLKEFYMYIRVIEYRVQIKIVPKQS